MTWEQSAHAGWIHRGRECEAKGDLDGAIDAYRSAIAAGETEVVSVAALLLGEMFERHGAPSEAAAALELVLDSQDSNHVGFALIALARIRTAMGDVQGVARAHFTAMALDHPEHSPRAAANLGGPCGRTTGTSSARSRPTATRSHRGIRTTASAQR